MNKNCMTTQQLLPHCLKLEVEPSVRLNDRNRHTRGDTRCPLSRDYVIMNMKCCIRRDGTRI